jgi:cytochrome c-type biogenesis protein CcmH
MRRMIAVLTLLVALVCGAPTALAVQRTTLAQAERQYMCVTCGIPLPEAISAQADSEKQYLQGLIDQGKTPAQIKALMVATYTDAVLALPPVHGFDTAAYVVPIVAVAALVALLALLLPRWRRRRAEQQDPAPGPALSAADAARLDADLARFER